MSLSVDIFQGRHVTVPLKTTRNDETLQVDVPAFLVEAFELINRNVTSEGIFRKPGSVARQSELRSCVLGLEPLSSDASVHDVAGLTKEWFRLLEVPILTESLQAYFLEAAKNSDDVVATEHILSLLHILPTANRNTLAFVVRELYNVAQHADQNLMTAENLARMFAMSLFRDPEDGDPSLLVNQVELKTRVVYLLIKNAFRVGTLSDYDKVMSPNGDMFAYIPVPPTDMSMRGACAADRFGHLSVSTEKKKKQRMFPTKQQLRRVLAVSAYRRGAAGSSSSDAVARSISRELPDTPLTGKATATKPKRRSSTSAIGAVPSSPPSGKPELLSARFYSTTITSPSHSTPKMSDVLFGKVAELIEQMFRSNCLVCGRQQLSLATIFVFIIIGFSYADAQHQQQQQQYQAPPQQQQQYQAPPQQQQQQYQAPPQQQAPGSAPKSTFHDTKEVHDEAHIKQHLDGQINTDTAHMTNEQLQFHYFKMHDSDNNNMLDGIELVKAITHFHTEDPAHAQPKMSENELEDMVDSILRDDDYNNDGFIDYGEFIKSQTRGATK